MDKLSQLWRRLLFYLRRDQFDRELEEEMRFHIEMKAEENAEAGMGPLEARFAAQRQFGNQTLLRLDFVHFVMPALRAGITKWTKSAVFEKVTADRVRSGRNPLLEKSSICEHCLPCC